VVELDRDLEGQGLVVTSARVVSSERRARSLRIPRDDLIALTTQLATVSGAGVRIVEGLTGIGERLASPKGRRLVEELVTALRSGASLSEAMDRHPASFPEVYRASVRAGEASGAIDTVLARLARYLEWVRGMRATTVQALIYPAILFVALFGLVLVLLYFVLPRIIGLFPGGRDQLPAQTRLVLSVSDFLTGNWMPLSAGAIALSVLAAVALRRPGGRAAVARALMRLPKVGAIARKLATSKFASTASILHQAGCDVFTVLGVAGETCGNAAMAAAFERASAGVRRGLTITQALDREGTVDPLLVQMVGVGEQTGDLDGCLSRLVEYYDEEVPRAVKRFLSFLEPAMLVAAGAVVAFILMAAILPIFDLYETLG
jgi:type II secretory pathway component PulF